MLLLQATRVAPSAAAASPSRHVARSRCFSLSLSWLLVARAKAALAYSGRQRGDSLSARAKGEHHREKRCTEFLFSLSLSRSFTRDEDEQRLSALSSCKHTHTLLYIVSKCTRVQMKTTTKRRAICVHKHTKQPTQYDDETQTGAVYGMGVDVLPTQTPSAISARCCCCRSSNNSRRSLDCSATLWLTVVLNLTIYLFFSLSRSAKA